MKKTLLFILLICFAAIPFDSNAQGWRWARNASCNESEGTFCATDVSGNIYGSGYFFGMACFGNDTLHTNVSGLGVMFLVKYDSMGTLRWASAPDIGLAYAEGIATDLFGHVYVLGIYDTLFRLEGHILSNPYPVSSTNFLAKYDSSGNVLWIKNIGSIDAGSNWGSTNIATDAYGNIYITGSFKNNARIGPDSITNHATGGDIFVTKLDSSGNALWTNAFGGNDWDISTGITVTPSGNSIYVAGYFSSDTLAFGNTILTDTSSITHYYGIFITKLNSLGNPVWAQGSGTVELWGPTRGVAIDSNEDVFITGSYSMFPITFGTFTLPQPGGYNGYLVKYSSSGNVEWAKSMQGQGLKPYSVSYDNCTNSIWIAGSMDANINDTIDGHILIPPPMNHEPSFIAGWYPDGTYIRSSGISTDGYSVIACDGQGNIGICGDGETDTLILGMDTLRNINERTFVAKYNIWENCALSSVSNNLSENCSVIVYPNPTANELVISSNSAIKTISIINLIGQMVYSNKCNSMRVQVNISSLPPGVYLVKINEIEVRKFVKE